MTRANKITVTLDNGVLTANLYKTHQFIKSIPADSIDDEVWTSNQFVNKTAEREAFRQYICNNAEKYDILWQPVDTSTTHAKPTHYADNDTLEYVARKMAMPIYYTVVDKFNTKYDKSGVRLKLTFIELDEIIPVYTTASGYDLKKMGVVDGKYDKNGCWAWANISMITNIEVTQADKTHYIYDTFTMQLVSGQLKNPHLTQTQFETNAINSLNEIGITVEVIKEVVEPKKSTKSKKADIPATDIKPKKSTKSKKADIPATDTPATDTPKKTRKKADKEVIVEVAEIQ